MFLSLFSIAQENKTSVSVSPSNNERIQQFKKEQAEKNYYYEMNSQLKEYFADNEIHIKVPKGQNFANKLEFIDAVNNWLRLNQNLIIENKKGVFLTK
ncbi:MAG: hypothetical protein U0V03_08955 [Bacteroidia bacterium]